MNLAINTKNISKSYPGVLANSNVSVQIEKSSIHAIVGENGAGKSTLMKILYGMTKPDQGEIEVFDQSASMSSPKEAINLGIGMVHQHFMLVPNFTALENIILGSEGKMGLKNGLQNAKLKLEELKSTYGLEVDLDNVTEDLPVGIQQRIEILKALYRGARVLILDEPTGVLTPQETDQLFEILLALKSEGVTIL